MPCNKQEYALQSSVAQQMDARHEQSGHVKDQPRPGRPFKANVAAVQHISMAAKLPECFSANETAAQTQQDMVLNRTSRAG